VYTCLLTNIMNNVTKYAAVLPQTASLARQARDPKLDLTLEGPSRSTFSHGCVMVILSQSVMNAN
jgi:hypothetical protein